MCPLIPFDLAEAEIDFTEGNEAHWNGFALPIPKDMVIVTTDSLKFKRGTGSLPFSQLPEIASISGIAIGEVNVSNLLVKLLPANNDEIIVVSNDLYVASSVTLTSLQSRIDTIVNNNSIETANMSASVSQLGLANTSISSTNDGDLVIIQNNQMTPGSLSESFVHPAPLSPINIMSVGLYSNLACTIGVSSFNNNRTYYAKVNPSHDITDIDNLTFGLTSNNSYVTVTSLGRGLFQLSVGVVPAISAAILTATVTYGTDVATSTKVVSLTVNAPVSPLNITNVGVYSDSACTVPVSTLYNGVTYYLKVTAYQSGVPTSNMLFSVTSSSTYVATSDLGNGLFSVVVGQVPSAGNVTLTAAVSYGGHSSSFVDVVALSAVPPISVVSIGVFSDMACTIPVTAFNNSITYYAQIIPSGGGGSWSSNTYTLTSNRGNVTTTNLGSGLFNIVVGTVPDPITLTLTGTASYGGNSASLTKSVQLTAIPPISIVSITTYSDAGCTVPITSLYNNTTYYVKIVPAGGGGSQTTDTYTLTDANASTTIAAIGNGVFSLAIGVANAGALVLTGTATFNLGSSSSTASVNLLGYSKVLECVYGGTGGDQFNGIAVDSSGNVFCAGSTSSEGYGSTDCLVVKFDSNLNILVRKIYGGSGSEAFTAICVDHSNNVICVGYTYSIGAGQNDALAVKFNNNLGLITATSYGGHSYDSYSNVCVDHANNIICTGTTYSDGSGPIQDIGTYSTAMIVKYNSDLNTILSQAYYDGVSNDSFSGVAVDSDNNIFCCGGTGSEGPGSGYYSHAIIIKYNNNLSITSRRLYYGNAGESFYDVVVDSSDNVICVGYTTSEGSGSNDTLVVKFNNSLGSIVVRKRYGGTNNDQFFGVAIDSSNNIICAGSTNSEGLGSNDCLVVKFDSSLNILSRKRYGGTGNDQFFGVAIDSSSNIYCTGITDSAGVGSTDAVVLKLFPTIQSGTFVGTVLTGLTLADSNLTLANSNLTLVNSNLYDGQLSLLTQTTYVALTLNSSNLTLTKDLLG